jgi:7,8-dihydropterin-6-yl-methyl-4-(beta-D-ribofuranosyl)aminobenzene 5'-phosphate synthase
MERPRAAEDRAATIAPPSPRRAGRVSALALVALLVPAGAAAAGRIVTLYDAFGPTAALEKDWGYSALVEYGDRRILFDTGNDAGIFERNVKRLGVDLRRLDAVVISHRHGDHTTGLSHLLAVNPGVKIYVPVESAYFGGPVPPAFLAPEPGLPRELRYFDGDRPRLASGAPWHGRFEAVTRPTEILPGVFVITTRSQRPGTMEMNELSLVVRTPRGLAVVVGCSHPGVEEILQGAARLGPKLHLVTGGLHLVATPRAEIARVAAALHDAHRVERVAPGHCTSEPGFAALLERFGSRFERAGVGAVLPLP